MYKDMLSRGGAIKLSSFFKEEWSACTQGHNNRTEVVDDLGYALSVHSFSAMV
jgi:hypothetical protein